MQESDPAPCAARLLPVTLATYEAFSRAAGATRATGYAAELAQRAEYQWRLAIHLTGRCAPPGLASDALWRIPDVRVQGSPADGCDPRILLGQCLSQLDVATLEFCRAYGPEVSRILSSAVRNANPVSTTSHRPHTTADIPIVPVSRLRSTESARGSRLLATSSQAG